MKILSLHLSHEGCASYVDDNKIIFHTQIDRYNRFKNTTIPSKNLIDIIKNLSIDLILISYLPWANSVLIWEDFFKSLPNLKKSKMIVYGANHHHLFHAYCSLTWNKSFSNIFVADGTGKEYKNDFERESLYNFNKEKLIHINTFNKDDAPTIGLKYELFSEKHFGRIDCCGKTMAWSLFDKKPALIQKNFETEMLDVLNKLKVKENILFTGGCAQNILFNSILLKKFKKVFCDPFNGDFGISLGAINYYLNNKIKNDSIYLGIPQDINSDIFYEHKINKCTPDEVCKILINEPVAIFQSRSEQGQRGLGNRSLLMNPLHKNAHEMLNRIKKREWFRPFACSIIKEKSKDWFEMDTEESPFMMYVFKLKKIGLLKTGVSKDLTCRIQTVKKTDNENYYNLLLSFEKLTGVPILANTSLNLPGEVLVETLLDLKDMFENSNLKYIYLPETQTLIKKGID